MKKELTIKEFLSKYKILIIVLILILAVPVIVFLKVFENKLYNVGAWASLVAGIITYLGSSFLGVVVFYNTQATQRQKEIEEQISVDIKYGLKNTEKPSFFIPWIDDDIDKNQFFYHCTKYKKSIEEANAENLCYLYFEIKNINPHIPIRVEPISIYVLKGKRLIDAGYNSYYSDMNDSDSIDYKQIKRCYIGTNKTLLKNDYYLNDENQLCYVGVKITSIKGQVLYATLGYYMGVSFGVGGPYFFTEKEYKENISKWGGPVYSSLLIYQTIRGQGARTKS